MFKKFKLLIISITMAFSLTQATAAFSAPSPTGVDVDYLNHMILKEIKYLKNFTRAAGYDLEVPETIRIEDREDFYKIIIPNVSFALRDVKKTLNIGTIIMHMGKRSAEAWSAKLSIPDNLSITDEAEDIDTNISIGKQAISLTWVPDKNIYPELSIHFDDVAIKSEKSNAVAFSMKTFDMKSFLNLNHTKDWAGINKMREWNGKTVVSIDDLKGTLNKFFAIKANKIQTTINYNQVSPEAILNNRVLLSKYVSSFDGEAFTAQDTLKAFASLTPTDKQYKTVIEAEGLDVVDIRTPTLVDRENSNFEDGVAKSAVKLEKISANSEVTGLKDGLYNVISRIEFKGLDTNGVFADYNMIMPQQGVIPISMRSIPLRAVQKLLVDDVLEFTNGRNQLSFFDRFIEASKPFLREASSYASIRNMSIKNQASDIKLSANARLNPYSIYGFIANAELYFDGYPLLASNLREIAGNPNIELDTLIKAFSNRHYSREQIPDSYVSIASYNINVTEDGRITVRDGLKDYRSHEVIRPVVPVDKPSKWTKYLPFFEYTRHTNTK